LYPDPAPGRLYPPLWYWPQAPSDAPTTRIQHKQQKRRIDRQGIQDNPSSLFLSASILQSRQAADAKPLAVSEHDDQQFVQAAF
jgi:hypothetical protein